VGAQSFFQSNLAVAEQTVSLVGSWLDEIAAETDRFIDLYCGVGLFSLALADRFATVLAADNDPSAVSDAQNNVRRDAIARRRVTVVQEAAETLLRNPELVPPGDGSNTCCLVDPPRAGLERATCAALAEVGPGTVIYLSCDPATLARDARDLVDRGYAVQRVKVLDMFPQTGHVETLVLLTRS
jgi:23S rRNA (uracil1939-C5)-methyltransferase